MAEPRWEDSLHSVLRQVADEVRAEAQRLLEGVMDKERWARVQANLRGLGEWARTAAEDLAKRVETASAQAEAALRGAARRGGGRAASPARARTVKKKRAPATGKKARARKKASTEPK